MGSALHDLETRAQQSEMNAYQQKAMTVGRPRLSHEEIQSLIGKGDGDTVARSLIAFAKAGDALNVQLAPYFAPPPKAPATLPKSSKEWKVWGWAALELLVGFFWLGSVIPFMQPETIPPESREAMTVFATVMTAIFAGMFVLHLRNRRKRP